MPVLLSSKLLFIANGTFSFLLDNPTLFAIGISFVQVWLLYGFGKAVAYYASCSFKIQNRLWYALVWIALLLPLIHFTVGGWPLTIRYLASTNEVVSTTTQPNQGNDPSIETRANGQSPLLATMQANSMDVGTRPVSNESSESLPGTGESVLPQGSHAASLEFDLESQPSEQTARSEASQVKPTWTLSWSLLLLWSYLLMGFGMLIPTVLGVFRTRRLIRDGRSINPLIEQSFTQAKEQLGLTRSVDCLECPELTMPLTCGLLRPRILLPEDFRSWSLTEQKIVLSHELAHIARGDVLAEIISRVLTSFLWLHPAAWKLTNQLRRSRELATDELVIRSGEDPATYANVLVAAVERMSLSTGRNQQALAGVAMASSGDIESRVKSILTFGKSPLSGRKRIWLILAGLLLLGSGTTFKLNLVPAVFGQETGSENETSPAEEPEGYVLIDPRALKSTVSLVERIRNSRVTRVEGEDHGPIFTVTGKVLKPDGSPAKGATVLLQESTQLRLGSSPNAFPKDRHLVCMNDVFAKTETDDEGNYSFWEVKSPTLPTNRYPDYWRWNVVAATDGFVGFTALPSERKPYKDLLNTIIALEQTATISGTVQGEKGEVQPGAIIQLSSTRKAVRPWGVDEEFQVWMSSFAPLVAADRKGRFEFRDVPANKIAMLNGNQTGFVGGGLAVATGDEITLGKNPDPRLAEMKRFNVVASPAMMRLEVGKFIRGTVTHKGSPVVGAAVRFGSGIDRVLSESDGSFELRYSEILTRFGQMSLAIVPPEETTLLRHVLQLDEEQLDKKFSIELKQGVRIQGLVQCEGVPAPGVTVWAKSLPTRDSSLDTFGGQTDADGRFSFTIPAGNTSLVLGSDVPGFQLPSSRDSRSAIGANKEIADHWVQRKLELSELNAGRTIELEPFEVKRTEPVAVRVLLPNGKPAAGALVRIWDAPWLAKGGFGQQRPVSNEVLTDSSGEATVLRDRGMPTTQSKAYVAAEWSRDGKGFHGRTTLSASAHTERLSISLESGVQVRGTVTLNGSPVVGARLSISQLVPMDPNRRFGGGGFRSTPLAEATTNEDGLYEVGVKRADQYSVSIRSMPGVNQLPGMGKIGRPTKAGIVDIQEFACLTGNETIAGRVLDTNREPMANIQVSIRPNSRELAGAVLLGYQENSQLRTDADGKFWIKNLPKGEFRLTVFGPRAAGRRQSVLHVANTGQTDLQILLNAESPIQERTLKVHSISDY